MCLAAQQLEELSLPKGLGVVLHRSDTGSISRLQVVYLKALTSKSILSFSPLFGYVARDAN
jgi:hypothetical protein